MAHGACQTLCAENCSDRIASARGWKCPPEAVEAGGVPLRSRGRARAPLQPVSLSAQQNFPEEKALTKASWRLAGRLGGPTTRAQLRIAREQGLYHRLWSEQEGRCAICQGAPVAPGEVLCLDHDHATGQIRGLLCRRCNAGLGYFLDQPGRLTAAAAYLEGRA